jgi:hypothetical protein
MRLTLYIAYNDNNKHSESGDFSTSIQIVIRSSCSLTYMQGVVDFFWAQILRESLRILQSSSRCHELRRNKIRGELGGVLTSYGEIR